MISNKNVFTISLLIILTSMGTLTAQRGQRGERLEAQRVAFITSELELTTQESERFWPVYNKYKDLEKTDRKGEGRRALKDEMSEAQADEHLKGMIVKEEKALANKKKLIADLQSVVSKQKIVRLFAAERKFKRKVLNEYSKRRKGKSRMDGN